MDSIIDSLTQSIQKFGIYKNEDVFDDELVMLMRRMDSVEISDNLDQNWEILQQNYSKLIYLHEMINFYYLPEKSKFIESLTMFMESIDRKTQYYLNQIDWYNAEPEFQKKSTEIHKLFTDSLNQNNPIIKLKSILKAYEILIPVIEDLRNEKCEHYLDYDFLETFPRKRQKKN